ncbi:MAG: hypothetical protein ACKPKO_17900 [Candidatus Fonsibacter sp.]
MVQLQLECAQCVYVYRHGHMMPAMITALAGAIHRAIPGRVFSRSICRHIMPFSTASHAPISFSALNVARTTFFAADGENEQIALCRLNERHVNAASGREVSNTSHAMSGLFFLIEKLY